MTAEITIDSLVLTFGSPGYASRAFTVRVKVDFKAIESFRGITNTERTLEITEDNILSAYQNHRQWTARTKIKAGPGKGRVRHRHSGITQIRKSVPFSSIRHYVEMASPLKLIGDWKYNIDKGTVRADVSFDPIVPHTRWGLPVRLLGFATEMSTGTPQHINDMVG